jgi:SNF2 family DNA or RNA helicase
MFSILMVRWLPTAKIKKDREAKDRMTEAEEDAQLLKSAESKRRIIRVDKQPSNLAIARCIPYQLEGLNWLIKLHDHGINGILADEVSVSFDRFCSGMLACIQNLNWLFSNYRWAW